MRVTLVVIATGLVASCQPMVEDGEPVSDPSIGLITNGNHAQVISAPDTVLADVSFPITVYTFGSSSCTIPDHVDLALSSSRATITPHDRASGQNTCTTDIAARPHPVELRFTTPGIATIHVIGAVISIEGARVAGSAERTVVVRR